MLQTTAPAIAPLALLLCVSCSDSGEGTGIPAGDAGQGVGAEATTDTGGAAGTGGDPASGGGVGLGSDGGSGGDASTGGDAGTGGDSSTSGDTTLGPPEAPEGKNWQVVAELTDEFDTWNDSKWWKSLWNYGEPVNMQAENAGVSNGNLWIKATLGSGSRWFNTSRVMSKAQIIFPMYTEARMKTAHISAFSTYWLNNGNIDDRDEIDICEHNSKPSFTDQIERPYTMYSQYFVVKNGVTERHHGNFDNRNLSDGNPAKGKTWNEDYQVLGAYWKDAHNIQFYINGEEAGSVTSTQPFTRKQNVIWDLWTSAETWTGGIADQSDLEDDSINTMYVDWIHTYVLVD